MARRVPQGLKRGAETIVLLGYWPHSGGEGGIWHDTAYGGQYLSASRWPHAIGVWHSRFHAALDGLRRNSRTELTIRAAADPLTSFTI